MCYPHPRDFRLHDRKVPLSLDRLPHDRAVVELVDLHPWRPHGWSFGAVEHTKLDAGAVGRPPDFAAERVELLDQVALASPPTAGLQGI